MLIVFDLDGTLIDTAPDLVDTLNVILAREGLEPIPFEEARGMIGAGARRLLERGLRRDSGALPGDIIERLYQDFLTYYSQHIADRSRAFPGLELALDALAGAGHQFAVCTNKLESLSVELLKSLNLAQRFNAICGQDTFGMQKPDPDILRRTIDARRWRHRRCHRGRRFDDRRCDRAGGRRADHRGDLRLCGPAARGVRCRRPDCELR